LGPQFLVGAAWRGPAPAGGTSALLLRYNDVPGAYKGNTGSYTAQIGLIYGPDRGPSVGLGCICTGDRKVAHRRARGVGNIVPCDKVLAPCIFDVQQNADIDDNTINPFVFFLWADGRIVVPKTFLLQRGTGEVQGWNPNPSGMLQLDHPGALHMDDRKGVKPGEAVRPGYILKDGGRGVFVGEATFPPRGKGLWLPHELVPEKEPAAEMGEAGAGLIAFQAEESVYLINPDGSGLREVLATHAPLGVFGRLNSRPMLSFDRQRIAFVRHWPKVLNYYGVWVMGLDGTNLAMVTPTGPHAPVDVSDVDWSPDGVRIAFSRGGLPGRPGIFLVTEGGGIDQVPLNVSPRGLCWSRDGRQIAFHVWPRGIWVLELPAARLMQVSPTGEWPSWSPDAAELLFEDAGKIGVISLADRTIRWIAEKAKRPFWSPDGRAVVFLRPEGFEEQVVVHDLASNAERVIYQGGVRYVCWR